jgi:hypothetical protein
VLREGDSLKAGHHTLTFANSHLPPHALGWETAICVLLRQKHVGGQGAVTRDEQCETQRKPQTLCACLRLFAPICGFGRKIIFTTKGAARRGGTPRPAKARKTSVPHIRHSKQAGTPRKSAWVSLSQVKNLAERPRIEPGSVAKSHWAKGTKRTKTTEATRRKSARRFGVSGAQNGAERPKSSRVVKRWQGLSSIVKDKSAQIKNILSGRRTDESLDGSRLMSVYQGY